MEDKIIQQAVATVLEAIYEEDFLGFSYGFRLASSNFVLTWLLGVELLTSGRLGPKIARDRLLIVPPQRRQDFTDPYIWRSRSVNQIFIELKQSVVHAGARRPWRGLRPRPSGSVGRSIAPLIRSRR
jgi:hypothetical protein